MIIPMYLEEFLQRNKELINNCDFVALSEKALDYLNIKNYSNMFYILIKSGLNPLAKFDVVPKYFLSDNEDIQQIELPNHIKAICHSAFSYCKNLRQINIPENVEIIDNGAFENCVNLTFISIPNSVTKLGNYTFYNCVNLTNIDLHDNIT